MTTTTLHDDEAFLLAQPPASRRTARRIGTLLLLLVGAFALCGPWLVGIDPAVQTLSRFLEAPSLAHPLGLDHLGRSMLARLASAAQLSLAMAAVSVLSAAVPGAILGVLAAWRGGWSERVLTALADAVLALPGLLLVLLLAAFAPGQFWPLYVGISLALWVEYFRVVRNAATILLAGIDPLRSEGEALAEAMESAGVPVNCLTYPGVTQGFFGLGLLVTKALFAQGDAADALGKAFAPRRA